MKVELVAVTQPVKKLQDLGVKTAEDLIVYCARVSNPSNQLNIETGEKLLRYCIKKEHWSVFEQADLTFEIKTSRAIAAQILRHKSFSFQEFSQRYSEVQEFEPIELRKQGKTNRQVGDEVIDPTIELSEIPIEANASHLINEHISCSNKLYGKLVESGVARECARMVLPLSTQTTLYLKGNLRSLIHYVRVRTAEDTQKEHREIAWQVKKIMEEEFPVVMSAFDSIENEIKHGFNKIQLDLNKKPEPPQTILQTLGGTPAESIKRGLEEALAHAEGKIDLKEISGEP